MHPAMVISILGIFLAAAQEENQGGPWVFDFGPELWDRLCSIDIDWKKRVVKGNSTDTPEPAFPSFRMASIPYADSTYPFDPGFIRQYFADREDELENIRKEVLLEETTNVPVLIDFHRKFIRYLQENCPLINRGWNFLIPDDAFDLATEKNPVRIAFDLVKQECFVDERRAERDSVSIGIPYVGSAFREWLKNMFQLKASKLEALREKSIVRERRTNIEYAFIDFVRGWFHEYDLNIPRIFRNPRELMEYLHEKYVYLSKAFHSDLKKVFLDETVAGSVFWFSSEQLREMVFQEWIDKKYIPWDSRLVFDEMKHLLGLDCFSIEVPDLDDEERDRAIEENNGWGSKAGMPEERSVDQQEDGRWTVVYHLPWKSHIEGLADE